MLAFLTVSPLAALITQSPPLGVSLTIFIVRSFTPAYSAAFKTNAYVQPGSLGQFASLIGEHAAVPVQAPVLPLLRQFPVYSVPSQV